MFRRKQQHVPNSPEYFESAELRQVDELYEQLSQVERKLRRVRTVPFVGGICVGVFAAVALPVAVRAGIDLLDGSDAVFQPDVASDFAYPPEDYVPPRCIESVNDAEQFKNRFTADLLAVYEAGDATNVNITNFSDTDGSYGNLSFDIDAPNGDYSVSMYIARASDGTFDPSTIYSMFITAATTEGARLSIDFDPPITSPDDGGPNFPVESLGISLDNPNGNNEWYFWQRETSDQGCEHILQIAQNQAAQMLDNIDQRAPIRIPKSLES